LHLNRVAAGLIDLLVAERADYWPDLLFAKEGRPTKMQDRGSSVSSSGSAAITILEERRGEGLEDKPLSGVTPDTLSSSSVSIYVIKKPRYLLLILI